MSDSARRLIFIAILALSAAATPPGDNPYDPSPTHPANRLHRALFTRTAPDKSEHTHTTDPLLYRGGAFLLEGESHRQAIAVLDEFLKTPDPPNDPIKRLFLQRDLWAAFDYVAWYPDDWVHKSRHEPAAIALRTRLARAIKRLSLDQRHLAALPDNYALAVKSKQFAAAHDPQHPERPFLPPDLFEPAGPWVRFHETTIEPMAQEHFNGAGGRAAHTIFLRLPAGRAATEDYLKHLNRDAIKQFPPGTMVAMARRAFAIDPANKLRLTPITELVQIRVYRRIPQNPRANMEGDFGQQDVCEFVLDRTKLFASEHGLRTVAPNDPAEPFARDGDPFIRPARAPEDDPRAVHGMLIPSLKTCIQCHQAPGVHSVLSMTRGLRTDPAPRGEIFRTDAFNIEISYTLHAKTRQFYWGLLQGMLESQP